MGLVIKATPWPLYRRERDLVLIVQEVGWVPEPGLTGVKNLASAGIFLKHKSFVAHILQLFPSTSPSTLALVGLIPSISYVPSRPAACSSSLLSSALIEPGSLQHFEVITVHFYPVSPLVCLPS